MASAAILVGAVLASPASAGGQGDPLLGDVNGDTYVDRATLSGENGGRCLVDVELGEPGGSFGPPTRYAYSEAGDFLYCPDMGVVVDLGGDNTVELVVTWFDVPPGVVEDLVVLRDFTRAGGFDALAQPSFIELAEFNGDGRMDVYEWTDQGSGLVSFINTAVGTLERGPVRYSWISGDFELADVNRNGAMDLVVGFDGGTDGVNYGVVVVLDDGRQVYLFADPTEGDFFWTVDVVDANGDGKPDVRTTGADTGTVTHFIGNGRGGFTPAPTAVDDVVQVLHKEQKTISILVNDAYTSDATFELVTPPVYGQIVRKTSKGFVYRSVSKHNDSFTYRLNDDGRSDLATVTLRVK